MIKYLFISVLFFASCTNTPREYVGADLSYVNEILDCGGAYRSNGELVDPYQLFSEKGTNLVRLRLWHNPTWAGYSNFEDVALAIKRSKAQGMEVLLDFHYSDTWADPQHQVIPKAWETITALPVLSDSLYNYTYATLNKLHRENLLPEFVQVGNEINIEIMQDSANMVVDTINWERNLTLINAGLKAVNDFSVASNTDIQKMIHIAQPENALWWFDQATKNGLADFEWIGLSYYPKWSSFGLEELSVALDSLIKTYEKELMIVETAYPHTLVNVDNAHNILGEDALIEGYPATPNGQFRFMKKLLEETRKSGGRGVIYWEPAWVTSDCRTLWGQGSHWENASFFDGQNGNEALETFDFFQLEPNSH
ncbi:MAG: glycosyl hydrolase 53 family protein [Cyclobacteriaceae bacterium]